MSDRRQASSFTEDEWSREVNLIEATLNLCPQWFTHAQIHTGFAADLVQFLVALKADIQKQAQPQQAAQPGLDELSVVEFALQSLALWEEYLQPGDRSVEQLRHYLHQRRSMLR